MTAPVKQAATEAFKAVKAAVPRINIPAASTILSNAAVNPTNLIAQNGHWTSTSYMYLIAYVVVFILCFILSLGSYREDDPTPYGHRLLYAISAGAWNILYLVYFALLR